MHPLLVVGSEFSPLFRMKMKPFVRAYTCTLHRAGEGDRYTAAATTTACCHAGHTAVKHHSVRKVLPVYSGYCRSLLGWRLDLFNNGDALRVNAHAAARLDVEQRTLSPTLKRDEGSASSTTPARSPPRICVQACRGQCG